MLGEIVSHLLGDLAPSVDLESDVASDDLNSSVSDGDGVSDGEEISVL
jgi:hypothetical protein